MTYLGIALPVHINKMLTYDGHVNTVNLLLTLSKYFSKLQ